MEIKKFYVFLLCPVHWCGVGLVLQSVQWKSARTEMNKSWNANAQERMEYLFYFILNVSSRCSACVFDFVVALILWWVLFFFGYSLPFSTNLVFKSKIHSKFSWKCVVSAQRQRHYFWSLANHFRSYLRRLAERECLLIDKSSFWPTCTENLTHTFRWIVILFMFWLLSVERR